jgi:hypothetical protein
MPVNGWSDKRERQFEHIKESLTERGLPDKKAKEIAARTVNKARARTGEAKTTSQPSRYDLSARPPGGRRRQKTRTLEQLYDDAKKLGIHGRSDMNRQELGREVDRKKRQ